jgi:hypothetical protein
MANEQQKIAILGQLANYHNLKADPRLKSYLDKACAALPDQEINFAEHIVKEIQDNCSHDGDKRIQPVLSVMPELKFEEKCSLCGHVIRKNVHVTEL